MAAGSPTAITAAVTSDSFSFNQNESEHAGVMNVSTTRRSVAMATRTSASEKIGKSKSSAAKSVAPAATSGSRRTRRGTSDTTTPTGANTPDPNTKPATEPPQRTASKDKTKPTNQSVETPVSGEGRAYVLAVFGAFQSRALVEMPIEMATELFGPIQSAMRPDSIAAVERDIAAIRELDPALADSSLAATALQMAYEMANPFNSATSKSMCARALLETMEQIRSLVPDGDEEGDELDELMERRNQREASQALAQ